MWSVSRAVPRLIEERLAAACSPLAVEPAGLVLQEGRAASGNWVILQAWL
jgi:hypothetical protein